jgi:undecaprenyl diphosphate synthase
MTLWAFSTENWKRAKEEVGYLMQLFEMMIDKNLKEAHEEQTCIIHLGRKDRMPESLQKKIVNAEQETSQYKKHYLCVGIDYGGEDEVVRAINKASQIPGEWTKEKLFSTLDTAALPQQQVDLVIRTSGEQRTSGFMPLQAAYSEYYFSKLLFPDFHSKEFIQVIEDYSLRNRRFGK